MRIYQNFILFILLQVSLCNKTVVNNAKTHSDVIQGIEERKNWTNQTNGIQRRKFGVLLSKVKEKAEKAGHYYEPYHEGGESVFLRTTQSPKPWYAKNFINKTIATTERPWTYAYTGNEMGINRDCYRDCPKVYSYDYGRVCGYRMLLPYWTVQYREFENMCELEQVNCRDPESMWQAIHRGVCPELESFRSYSIYKWEIHNRAKQYQIDIAERVKDYEARYAFMTKEP